MTDSTRKSIISKIQKCLALSDQDNPNEAATALKQAIAMMEKYGITKSEVELAQITESKADLKVAQKPENHVWSLCTVIKLAFGVDFYKQGKDMVFYGINDKAAIASYAFDVLFRQLKKARKEYSNSIREVYSMLPLHTRRKMINDFSAAWIAGVHSKVVNFAMTEQESTLMKKYTASLNARVISSRSGRPRISEAVQAGLKEGKRVEIYQPTEFKGMKGIEK